MLHNNPQPLTKLYLNSWCESYLNPQETRETNFQYVPKVRSLYRKFGESHFGLFPGVRYDLTECAIQFHMVAILPFGSARPAVAGHSSRRSGRGKNSPFARQSPVAKPAAMIIMRESCPRGGIGRRGRLKICCLHGRACSSQAGGTISNFLRMNY